MNAKSFLSALLAGGLGLAVMVGGVGDVQAQGKGRPKKTAVPAPMVEPPMMKKPVVIDPDTLKWGMNHKQVTAAYDKVLEADYKPLFQKVSPGVKMKALEAQLDEDKNTFRRSRIDFGKLPTTVDATPLRGEFTYLNQESMMSLTRNGQTRYFFFIGNKLWKIIDEIKLVEGGPLGKDLKEATAALAKKYGVAGRVIQPNPDKGVFVTVVDWKDGTNHIRLVERSETAVAVVYEESATLASIDSLRPNKPQDDNAIDPAVAAAVQGAPPPDAAPPFPQTGKASTKTQKK